MDKKTHDKGLEIRKAVLGEAYVSNALKNADDFNKPFQVSSFLEIFALRSSALILWRLGSIQLRLWSSKRENDLRSKTFLRISKGGPTQRSILLNE